eukprot:61048-Lingulodinium_polyedra.AAC.1
MGCPWPTHGQSMANPRPARRQPTATACPRHSVGNPWAVRAVAMDCRWVVHGLAMDCPWTGDGLCTKCPLFVHGQSMVSSWATRG